MNWLSCGRFRFAAYCFKAKEAARFGINADRAVRYQCDSVGTALNFEVISEAVTCARAAASLQDNWKDRIEADFKKRGKK